MIHAAGRIQAGRQPESDILSIKNIIANTTSLRQGHKAGTVAGIDKAESGFAKDAVFIDQRHHIRNGAQSHQVTVTFQVGFRSLLPESFFAQVGSQTDEEKKSDPHTGQMF